MWNGEKFKRAAAAAGLNSQIKVSMATGIHPSQISLLMTGVDQDPRLSTILRVCKALKCHVGDLVDEDDEAVAEPTPKIVAHKRKVRVVARN